MLKMSRLVPMSAWTGRRCASARSCSWPCRRRPSRRAGLAPRLALPTHRPTRPAQGASGHPVWGSHPLGGGAGARRRQRRRGEGTPLAAEGGQTSILAHTKTETLARFRSLRTRRRCSAGGRLHGGRRRRPAGTGRERHGSRARAVRGRPQALGGVSRPHGAAKPP